MNHVKLSFELKSRDVVNYETRWFKTVESHETKKYEFDTAIAKS